MKLQSTLLSGAGNTFHIFYGPEVSPSAQLAQKICDQDPADGVVFLHAQDEKNQSYSWDFYNNDGSLAEMCGNATRCVGYFVEKKLQKSAAKIYLQTASGLVEINSLGNNQYRVYMTQPEILPSCQNLFVCNTGVPHVVIEIPRPPHFDQYKDQCRQIRNDLNIFPQGTNVTLVTSADSSGQVEACSFERGVEDFTQACGTGAIAAGLYRHEKYKINKTSVKMPGGLLEIDMTDTYRPIMIGPVQHLKDCFYDFEI